MQKTKIYIYAAADGLKQDAMEIEAFIRSLNDCCIDRGHYFTPVRSDNTSAADAYGAGDQSVPGFLRTPDAGVAQLPECALAFFLVGPGESAPFSKGEAYRSGTRGSAAPFSKGTPPSGAGGLPDIYQTALTSFNRTGRPRLFAYTKSEGSGTRDQGTGN